MNPDDVIPVILAQHRAIDLLMAMLIQTNTGFMPSTSGEIWSAVENGHDLLCKLDPARFSRAPRRMSTAIQQCSPGSKETH